MPKHGDIYRHSTKPKMEAQLTTPATVLSEVWENDDTARWTYGGFIRVSGQVVAHVEPWINIDDPNSGDHDDLFVFDDLDLAQDRGDALLKTLGFVPVV